MNMRVALRIQRSTAGSVSKILRRMKPNRVWAVERSEFTMKLIPFRYVFAFVTALLGLQAAVWAAPVADPSGVWTVKAEGPNGREFDSTLTLAWANGQLSGTIDNRAGKVDIGNAKFAGDQVSFTVTRRVRFRKLVVTYVGKIDGDTLNGTLETKGRGSIPISAAWHATRGK
jgi:hypothetical protein